MPNSGAGAAGVLCRGMRPLPGSGLILVQPAGQPLSVAILAYYHV